VAAVIGVSGAGLADFAGTVEEALGSAAGAGPAEVGGVFEQAAPRPKSSDRINRAFIPRLPKGEAKSISPASGPSTGLSAVAQSVYLNSGSPFRESLVAPGSTIFLSRTWREL
jgi:hypothetical protein